MRSNDDECRPHVRFHAFGTLLRPTAMFAQYGGRLIGLNRVETVPGRANVALGNARHEFGPWSVIARRPAPDRRSKGTTVAFHARSGDLGRVVGVHPPRVTAAFSRAGGRQSSSGAAGDRILVQHHWRRSKDGAVRLAISAFRDFLQRG